MLHDPKWDHGTLAGLIHWLEGKPRDGTYNFSDCGNCLIVQYMGEYRRESWSHDMLSIYAGHDPHRIAVGPIRDGLPQTYGAALERAYQAVAAVAA